MSINYHTYYFNKMKFKTEFKLTFILTINTISYGSSKILHCKFYLTYTNKQKSKCILKMYYSTSLTVKVLVPLINIILFNKTHLILLLEFKYNTKTI